MVQHVSCKSKCEFYFSPLLLICILKAIAHPELSSSYADFLGMTGQVSIEKDWNEVRSVVLIIVRISNVCFLDAETSKRDRWHALLLPVVYLLCRKSLF